MVRIARVAGLTFGLLLALDALPAAQATRGAGTPADQTTASTTRPSAEVEKIRQALLAAVDRMPADQQIQYGDRTLSKAEFRAELSNRQRTGIPVRQATIETLRAEVEKKEAARVAAANTGVAQTVRALKKRRAADTVSAENIVQGMVAGPPHVAAIGNVQPSYSPGMYIVIEGSGFVTNKSSGGVKPPRALIKYKGKNASNQGAALDVVDDPGSGITPDSRVMVARFPADLGGIMDQTVQLYVEAGPADDRVKSNEVPVPFRAKRVVKTVETQYIKTQLCYSILPVCDREYRDPAANWQFCTSFYASENNIPWNGYSNSRYAVDDKVRGYTIRTLHEGRCLHGDSAPGIDLYGIPLFNGHELSGTSTVTGFAPSGGFPVYHAVPDSPYQLLEVWFLLKDILYYGINVQVVGPAGIPYQEAW